MPKLLGMCLLVCDCSVRVRTDVSVVLGATIEVPCAEDDVTTRGKVCQQVSYQTVTLHMACSDYAVTHEHAMQLF